MPADSWKLAPGLNHVGSYQVSGRPFVSGTVVAPVSGTDDGNAIVVRFPYVTKWVQIEPVAESEDPAGRLLRVGFSHQGVFGKGTADDNGGYHFKLHPSSSLRGPLDIKVSELWFMSDDNKVYEFDVVAGLTNIPTGRVDTTTSASAAGLWTPDGAVEAGGPSWSGSAGVG
jgi:hypothetical protein